MIRQHARFHLFLLSFLCMPLTSLLAMCNFDHCCGYAKGMSSKVPLKEGGFIEKHEKMFFSTLRTVDKLMDHYVDYYSVDTNKRAIIVRKEPSAQERTKICALAKELDGVINTFSKCSPGDHDYMDVKEKYLPLAKEMRHRFHTYVMQPLNVSRLELGDHVRKIAVPAIVVASAVGLILILKHSGLLPSWLVVDGKTLYPLAAVVAAAGIVYNYKDQIMSHSKQIELLALLNNGIAPGTDFGALAKNVAKDVVEAVSASSDAAIPSAPQAA